jgi:hypothetical protein
MMQPVPSGSVGKHPLGKQPVNHSAVVALLEKHRLASAYHHFFSESQGQETQPTYYLYHHKNRPYRPRIAIITSYLRVEPSK